MATITADLTIAMIMMIMAIMVVEDRGAELVVLLEEVHQAAAELQVKAAPMAVIPTNADPVEAATITAVTAARAAISIDKIGVRALSSKDKVAHAPTAIIKATIREMTGATTLSSTLIHITQAPGDAMAG